jgi:hypothetical protein
MRQARNAKHCVVGLGNRRSSKNHSIIKDDST